MKKFALMLASALLVLSAASAMAAVPSKTTTDVTHVKSVETVKEDGKTEAAGWDIDVTEDEAPVIEEIAKIYDWVAAKGKSAVSYFPEETQQAISALLPEGFKLENMTMNEFVTLTLTGDVDVLNDAKVTFTFTTKYTQDCFYSFSFILATLVYIFINLLFLFIILPVQAQIKTLSQFHYYIESSC